jgi:hypothetical protein
VSSRAAPVRTGGLGPAAERDLGGQEAADPRVVVHARVQRGAKRARGERVDGDPGAGQLDGQVAGVRVASHPAWRSGW